VEANYEFKTNKIIERLDKIITRTDTIEKLLKNISSKYNNKITEEEAKKEWVCQACGKSTFETDFDYIVHPKLHLGCALEEEMKGKGIKEQYHEASSRLFKDRLKKNKDDENS
jgi:hypothetical protein